MSLWFLGKGVNGRRSLYQVGIHWPTIIPLIALVLAVLLPLLRALF